jgi:mRNA interferase RelE/StbE
MTKYSVEVSATAERQIRKMSRTSQIRVLRAIRDLAGEPRPPGSRKLRGYEDVYRIRVGTYRILYSVRKKRLLIIVLKVGQRKDIYR